MCAPLDEYPAELSWRKAYRGRNLREEPLRHRQKETDCGTQRCRNAFLKQAVPFTRLPPPELLWETLLTETVQPGSRIAGKLLSSLRDSFFQVCPVFCKSQRCIQPGISMAEGIDAAKMMR